MQDVGAVVNVDGTTRAAPSSSSGGSGSEPPRTNCSMTVAAERAQLLLGCYRPGDANDPEIYAAGIVDILRSYPEDVVRRVTAPRTGLPGRLKWLPTIAEVRQACEAEMAPQRREAERNRRITSADRLLAAPERGPRKTYDELVAECERRGGMVPRPKERRGSTEEERREAERELAALKARAAEPSGIRASDELRAALDG